jgi:predicted nucleotidyltransferase component of viral defense system
MLFTDTVSSSCLAYLNRLMEIPEFNHFFLVGGTALSLKYGHRQSIDIDLFSSIDFDNNEVEKCIRFYFIETPAIDITHVPFGIFCHLGDVKVDFMKWGDEWIADPEIMDGIRIASDKDIFPMKLEAAMKRGAKKDFLDLALLINKHGLASGLDWYHEKFHYNDAMIPLKSLTDFERAEKETTPVLLNSTPWHDCKQTIVAAVRELVEKN